MTFKDFWTNNNNPSLPMSEYLYGTRHIFVLILTLAIILLLSFIFYRRSEKCKNILFNVMGYTLLTFEILSRVVNIIIEDNLNLESFAKIILPMHICSVMVWIFIISIFTKNKTLLNFASIGGILATLAFLLYPAVGLNRVYMSFTCIYSTVSHMIGFICAILMIVLKRVDFDIKHMWKTYVCFVIMFLWGALLNFVIFPGSDYMYMVNDPLGLNMKFPYQITYSILIAIYICLFYLITFIKNKIKNRKVIELN